MSHAMRLTVVIACAASLLALALALGLITGLDEDGNLDTYLSNRVVLLTFCIIDITALCAIGIIGRPSASAVGSSLLAMLIVLVYRLTVIAEHPGEFATEYSSLADAGITAWGAAFLAAESALLAGLLGAGASIAYLGTRRLRNSVSFRRGAT